VSRYHNDTIAVDSMINANVMSEDIVIFGDVESQLTFAKVENAWPSRVCQGVRSNGHGSQEIGTYLEQQLLEP